MSATEMANKFFGDFVPGCFIHEGFVENARFVHRFPQSAHGEDEIRTGRHGKSDIDRKNFFIMDDLGYDAPIWVKNKDIKFLFMNGRHIHTLFPLTLYPVSPL
jgi:hypothetical protein